MLSLLQVPSPSPNTLVLCLIYSSDASCSVAFLDWGRGGFWYPGISILSENVKATVGSFMCVNSTFKCPDMGRPPPGLGTPIVAATLVTSTATILITSTATASSLVSSI